MLQCSLLVYMLLFKNRAVERNGSLTLSIFFKKRKRAQLTSKPLPALQLMLFSLQQQKLMKRWR